MTGRPAFSAAGQNQSAVPSVSHAAWSQRNSSRTPNTPGSVSQGRKPLRPLRFVNRNTRHDAETAGITSYRLLRIIEPLAFERPAER